MDFEKHTKIINMNIKYTSTQNYLAKCKNICLYNGNIFFHI